MKRADISLVIEIVTALVIVLALGNAAENNGGRDLSTLSDSNFWAVMSGDTTTLPRFVVAIVLLAGIFYVFHVSPAGRRGGCLMDLAAIGTMIGSIWLLYFMKVNGI